MSLEKINIELKESNIKLEDLKLETVDTNEYLNLANDTLTEKLNELIAILKGSPSNQILSNNNNTNSTLKESKETNNTLKEINITFSEKLTELTEFLKGSSLKEIEKQREERVYKEKLLTTLGNKSSKGSGKDDKKNESFFGSLSSLGLLFGALAVGAGALVGAFKSSFDVLKILVTDIGKLLTGLFKAITPTAILKEIDLLVDFFKLIGSKLKTGVTSVIDDIVKLFSYVGDYFKGIKDGITKIPGISGLTELVDDIVKMFGKFGSVFMSTLKFVGRIFAPLFTLYETVKGAIEGYGEEEDIAGAIIGAVKGFFKGLVGDFLNIIKDIISWIVGALGFKELETLLDSFDFNKLFNSVFDGVISFFKNIVNWISGKFDSATKFVADVMPNMDMVKEFFKSVLRNVLPIADSGKKWYDVGNLVSKAIPNSVYKFAGIDPKTGALTEEPKVDAVSAQQIIAPSVSRNAQMTNEMSQSQQEQDALKAQTSTAANISSQSNTVNNMTNNNTTVVKPSPSATRVPQAASDMFYNQMGYAAP